MGSVIPADLSPTFGSLTPHLLDDEIENALVAPEFRQAIREGSIVPIAMLTDPRYSIEELDEELNR